MKAFITGEEDGMNDIEKLFEEYSDCIYRFCCNISDSLYEAEDLFQDTFLKAMEIEKKIMAVDNKRSYLIGIALRLEKNNRRKKARHRRIAPEARGFDREADVLEAIAMDEKSIEESFIEKEQIDIVRQNIGQLEATYKIIASLYYGESMSIKEIAEIVKLPPGTVKSRLYKIRGMLRRGLED